MSMRRAALVALVGVLSISAGCDSDDEETRSSKVLGLEGNRDAGEGIFTMGTCSADGCHSTAPSSTDLTDVVPNLTSETIVDSLINGKGLMPTQGALSDQQLADVLAYIEETF